MKFHLIYIQILIVILIGCSLSYGLFQFVDSKSRAEVEQRFIANSNDRFLVIEKNIQSEFTNLKAVAGLYGASNKVDRREFSAFVKKMLEDRDSDAFQAFEWIPRVSLSDRKKHEDLAIKDGFLKYKINELTEEGELVAANKRREYFPIYFIEPYKGNEEVLGFDLASDLVRERAINKARDTGGLVTSAKINLVQLNEDRTGVLFFYPIYKKDKPHDSIEQRRLYLQGFALGVASAKSLISGAHKASNNSVLKPMGIDFYVYDLAEVKQKTLLYIHKSRSRTDEAPDLSLKDARTGHYVERIVNVGDRQWGIIARPYKADFAYVTMLQNWILLCFGLIMTLLSSVYMYRYSSHTRGVENLIKRRTEELHESEEQHRTILDAVADAIITIDSGGIVQTFNLAAEKMFFYSASEIIGKNVSVLLPEDERKAHENYTENSSIYASPIINQTRNLEARRKDGSCFPMELNVAPMQTDGYRGFVGILRDTSDRKKIERELNRFKTTLDETMDCVFMFEPDSLKFFYVNAGAMGQVGYSFDEMMEMRPFDIKPEFDEGCFREAIAPMIAGTQPILNFETLHQHKDGHTLPVEIFLQYINPPDESPRFVAIVRDISERKRIDKMKGEFVSTVSHELRTPLTAIRGSLGLIAGGVLGEVPEKAQEMLKIAGNNTERLLLLINDILDIEKIESGKMAFKFHSLELMSFIDQALKDNAAYADQHGVKFVIAQETPNVRIYADKDRLMQVMANLLSNAAKYSPPNETVEISVAYFHNDSLRISVTDHGDGIPEEFQPRLFDKFTQHDSSTTREKGGTGLGLSIAKEIVEKHGGHIGFVSREGTGATFYVELPELKCEIEQNPGELIRQLPKQHLACVLIVEDDPDIAAIMKRMLAEGGYNADIVHDANGARQQLQKNSGQYKAITLDLMLPGEDGFSFLESLKRNPATSDIPVVVVSVSADESKRNLSGGAMAVVDWLQKPIDQQRLINVVKKMIVPPRKLRVLHVEDVVDVHKVVSVMLRDYCELIWTSTFAASKEKLESEDFDLVLLDVGLPDGSGLDLLETIEQCAKPPRVVIFSAYDVSQEYADTVSAVLVKSKTDNFKLLDIIKSL